MIQFIMRFDWTNHRYGASWYRYYDGQPHPDDDDPYYWTGFHWAKDFDAMKEEDASNR